MLVNNRQNNQSAQREQTVIGLVLPSVEEFLKMTSSERIALLSAFLMDPCAYLRATFPTYKDGLSSGWSDEMTQKVLSRLPAALAPFLEPKVQEVTHAAEPLMSDFLQALKEVSNGRDES